MNGTTQVWLYWRSQSVLNTLKTVGNSVCIKNDHAVNWENSLQHIVVLIINTNSLTWQYSAVTALHGQCTSSTRVFLYICTELKFTILSYIGLTLIKKRGSITHYNKTFPKIDLLCTSVSLFFDLPSRNNSTNTSFLCCVTSLHLTLLVLTLQTIFVTFLTFTQEYSQEDFGMLGRIRS